MEIRSYSVWYRFVVGGGGGIGGGGGGMQAILCWNINQRVSERNTTNYTS